MHFVLLETVENFSVSFLERKMANGERQVTQDDIVNGILHMIHGQLGAANQQGQLSGMARQTVEFFRAVSCCADL